MRIAFVTPFIGNAFGLEKALWTTAEGLVRNGHEVLYITDQVTANFEVANLHRVPGLGRILLQTPPWEVRRVHGQALDILARARPDVVHLCDLFDQRLVTALVRAAYPLVLTAHTVAPSCPASHRFIRPFGICDKPSGLSCIQHHRDYGCLDFLKSDFHRLAAVTQYWLRRGALRENAYVAAISKYVAETLIKDGFNRDRVRVVPNAALVPKIEPLRDGPPNLLVIAARLVALKGIDFALRALAPLKELTWTLWICGSGQEECSLKKLCTELGLSGRVQFLGQTLPEKTYEIIASARALLQTNSGPEGFGMSVAEAAAYGVPVIGFNVPALNEIVENGITGELVELGNVGVLTQTIRKLLVDRNYLESARTAGPRLVQERFSLERHVRGMLRLYEDAMRGKTHRCSSEEYAEVNLA